jgi:Ca2+-binding RTX toxin-like protein
MTGEIRVNTYQDNWQRDADITTFADGSFLVVYEGYFNNYDDNPSYTYVAAQRYDASGNAVGGEKIIDREDYCSSSDARVTTLSDGGYAIVYCFDDYDDILTTREKVFVNIYNADGSARAVNIRVDTVQAFDALVPEVFATANGGFKVVYGAYSAGPKFDQIYSQQFTASGAKVGGNTLVNVNEGDFDEIYARSATLENGSTITIWNSEGAMDDGSNQVRGMLTRPDGTVLRADFGLSENYGSPGLGSGGGYDVAALNNGGFVISHKNYDFELGIDTEDTSYYTIFQFFNAAGNRTSGKIVAFASDDLPGATRIAQLTSGEIVVVWEQDPLPAQQQISDDIYGRMFTADGTPLTGVFEISVDAGSYDEQSEPELEALAGGGFVVTYTSESIDSDDDGVAMRIFGRATDGDDVARVDATGMMAGLDGDDRLTGTARANAIYGNDGQDSLYGGDGRDRLIGGNNADRIYGGDGDDTLSGSTGRDTLTGGAGADEFQITKRPPSGDADHITGWGSADVLSIQNSAFAGIGPAGRFDGKDFKLSGQTLDSGDRLIYDRASGTLYFDSNGSGSGGRTAIAIFDSNPALTAADIILV